MYSIYCIEESKVSQDNICYVSLVRKEKQHCYDTYFYFVFITEKGMNTVRQGEHQDCLLEQRRSFLCPLATERVWIFHWRGYPWRGTRVY